MTDFLRMDDATIAAFAVAHRMDMAAAGLESADILRALELGSAVIERRDEGFAVVQLEPTSDGKAMPFLWLLYIAPAHRDRGFGQSFVRNLLRLYSSDYHMTLHCEGAQRRRFFGRAGFVVEGRDGEMRYMTTNRQRRN